MSDLNDKRITAETLSIMIPMWAQVSILGKACVCTSNEEMCPFGGNLGCLQRDFLQTQSVPHNCVEPLKKLCLDSVKTIWKVAEVYAEDIFLIDIPETALQRFLDIEKAKQSQKQ